MNIMDVIDSEKSKEEFSENRLDVSELVEVDNKLCDSTLGLKGEEVSNNKSANNVLEHEQNILESSGNDNEDRNSVTCRSSAENPDVVDPVNFNVGSENENFKEDLSVLDVPVLQTSENLRSSDEPSVAVVKVLRPLCADYKSDSGSESVDSESDSSAVSVYSTTDTSSEDISSSDDSFDSDTNEKEKKLEKKKLQKDLSLIDLPPIEDLRINVPEDACVEIGTITSIVETLVVVESYKGTAALDLDTVLFLDCGKRTLGMVFEILGPVTEPVYTVRFNSQEQIKSLNIEKNSKVYYAPKTQHTNFVFMTEVLRNKGSDASWKDNTEAPSEFQDFSDDEQERLYKNKEVKEIIDTENLSFQEQSNSKKRPYKKVKPSSEVFHSIGFRNPKFCSKRWQNIQGNPSNSQTVLPFPRIPPGYPSPVFDPIQTSPVPYNVPARSMPPPIYFPSRFSGPPFPVFGNLPAINQNQNFQQPFHEQRSHGYFQTFGSWGRPARPMFRYQLPPPPPPPPPPPLLPPLPPPPPPPPAVQDDRQP